MNKFFLSGIVILAFVAYTIHYQLEGSSGITLTPSQQTINIPPAQPTPPNSDTPQPILYIPTPTPAPTTPQTPTTNKTGYKDGSYTGIVVDAFYGNVQVKATISGGRITDITFLDYPHDRRTSQEINSQAMPILKSEAIQIQTANVDIVSGATATSQAFVESLQSALNQAK